MNTLQHSLLNSELIGSESFRMIKITLNSQNRIRVEPGAMASQQTQISVDTKINGGILKALISKFFGGESFFINDYYNSSNTSAVLHLTQKTPGDIICRELKGEDIFLEAGAFIACTPQIRGKTIWAGFASWFAGEGLFRLKYTGSGQIWFGSYGAIIEKELNGDLLVDSGHLLAYSNNVKLSIKLAGSLFSSFVSKEGFVLKLSGKGKVLLQTRSVKGLAGWLNSKFWG
jgi:uncharacterized protein (TIGR00266 family)